MITRPTDDKTTNLITQRKSSTMKAIWVLFALIAVTKTHADDGHKDSLDGVPVSDQANLNQLFVKVFKADEGDRASINELVDQLFAQLRKFVADQGIDPIYLPTDSDTFTVTLYNQTMNGMFDISNVRIGGFSAIHRTGDCSTTITLQGTDVVLDFGSNDILLGVDIYFGAGILGANIQLELVVSHVSLMVKVRLTNNGLSLQDFKLNEIGRVNFDIKGIPMGSKSISNLLNVVSNSVKDTLLYAFQEALRPLIESILTSPKAASFVAEHLSQM